MQHLAPHPHRHSRRAAFTLIELLVVIGIIVVLASILIPTISHIRNSAHQSSTASRVQAIMNAIDNYVQTSNAYPGPLADSELMVDPTVQARALNGGNTGTLPTNVTGTENLVLALMGGLRVSTLTGTQTLNFDNTKVGNGAVSLNPVKPSQVYGPYIEAKVAGLQQASSSSQWSTWSDPMLPSGSPPNAKLFVDTVVPEFVDAYPDALPLLYIRAVPGASGSITGAKDASGNIVAAANAAYDPRQLQWYVFPAVAPGPSPTTVAITNNLFVPAAGIDPQVAADFNQTTATPAITPANYFGQYLSPAVPRNKGFLLITAGPDRKYMTHDDTINNGSAVK